MSALERTFARWHDRENAILILLGVFVVAWTAFHTLVFAPTGLHTDLTEVFSWSRHPAAGYYKHPPLSALICAAWFAIFPSADGAFYLLAMVNAAAGLFFIDLIARRYVPDAKRPMVLLLLLLTPFYQFIGNKFNANAVLLSTWPLAVYCFLRAFESRTVMWSMAAGLAAALAMLGKYYSIYLIAGIVIGALTHPQAGRYLKSPSPWISAAVGALALAPHAEWLWRTGFQPFGYAYVVHGQPSALTVFTGVAGYLAGAVGYVLLPLAIYAVIVSPSRKQFLDTLWPRDGDRRMLTVMLAVFLLLPALTAPLLRIELTSLWTMQSWFLLPVILLAAPSAKFARSAALRCAGGLLIFTILAVALVAPALAWINFSRPDRDDRGYSKMLSEEATKTWHARVGRPLTIVLGDNNLAASVEFYSPDHPDAVAFFALKTTPWVTPERMQTEGFAAVCNATDAGCLSQANELASTNPRALSRSVEITPTLFGYRARPAIFIIVVSPPRAMAGLAAAP